MATKSLPGNLATSYPFLLFFFLPPFPPFPPFPVATLCVDGASPPPLSTFTLTTASRTHLPTGGHACGHTTRELGLRI
jgi:hypothetical protein